MSRLIDADLLKETYLKTTDCALKCIDEAPTVEERKHGHWKYWCGRFRKCSACGYEYLDLVECKNYCGNCGAIMEEVRE